MSVLELANVDREQALGAIITAYNEVTDRLKDAHERLQLEVRRLRQELERKNEALRRSERLAALGEMAAGLAHEVRNPLCGIALQASVLEREVTDRPQAAAAAQRICQGVRTLDRLVTDVLSFAQEGRLELGATDPSAVVDRALAHLQPYAIELDTRVVVDPCDAPLCIVADATRLERALFNLLLNAVQATGRAGRVTIATRPARDDEGVELVIADDGPGIAPEHLDRIFNPFFTTKAEGTGLGLSIVHRIIEAHAGRITVHSRPGAGATFMVWLPRTSATGRARLPPSQARREARPPAEPRVGGAE